MLGVCGAGGVCIGGALGIVDRYCPSGGTFDPRSCRRRASGTAGASYLEAGGSGLTCVVSVPGVTRAPHADSTGGPPGRGPGSSRLRRGRSPGSGIPVGAGRRVALGSGPAFASAPGGGPPRIWVRRYGRCKEQAAAASRVALDPQVGGTSRAQVTLPLPSWGSSAPHDKGIRAERAPWGGHWS
jgi:hypothetical protein